MAYKIDPGLCTDCGACADVCPTETQVPGVKGAHSDMTRNSNLQIPNLK